MAVSFTPLLRTSQWGHFFATLEHATMTINIIVRSLGDGHFRPYVGSRPLGRATSTPFYSAARVLLSEGVSPDTVITMQHEGSSIISLRSTIGKAARLTVTEEDRKGLRIKEYRPPTFEQYQQRGSVRDWTTIKNTAARTSHRGRHSHQQPHAPHLPRDRCQRPTSQMNPQ